AAHIVRSRDCLIIREGTSANQKVPTWAGFVVGDRTPECPASVAKPINVGDVAAVTTERLVADERTPFNGQDRRVPIVDSGSVALPKYAEAAAVNDAAIRANPIIADEGRADDVSDSPKIGVIDRTTLSEGVSPGSLAYGAVANESAVYHREDRVLSIGDGPAVAPRLIGGKRGFGDSQLPGVQDAPTPASP